MAAPATEPTNRGNSGLIENRKEKGRKLRVLLEYHHRARGRKKKERITKKLKTLGRRSKTEVETERENIPSLWEETEVKERSIRFGTVE